MTGKKELYTKDQAWEANQKIAEIHRLLNIDIDNTMRHWKYAYIDLFVTMHKGNLSAACRDLGVSYRTITNWMHEARLLKSKSRGRFEALKYARSRRGKSKEK